jgi:hypothetical protein
VKISELNDEQKYINIIAKIISINAVSNNSDFQYPNEYKILRWNVGNEDGLVSIYICEEFLPINSSDEFLEGDVVYFE